MAWKRDDIHPLDGRSWTRPTREDGESQHLWWPGMSRGVPTLEVEAALPGLPWNTRDMGEPFPWPPGVCGVGVEQKGLQAHCGQASPAPPSANTCGSAVATPDGKHSARLGGLESGVRPCSAGLGRRDPHALACGGPPVSQGAHEDHVCPHALHPESTACLLVVLGPA